MKIDIITIFPEMFTGPFDQSMVKRAQEKKAIKINIHNLRDWTEDKHHSVDAPPYGGGAGMVMLIEPIFKAVNELRQKNSHVILTSAKGDTFSQDKSTSLSLLEHLIIICGHYEGIDQRVYDHIADDIISIGDYVLTGGELPAMVIVDAVTRLIPGVVGSPDSLVDESHRTPGYLEYPHYTRPAEFNGWQVPDVLLSGDHAKIENWRKANAQNIR